MIITPAYKKIFYAILLGGLLVSFCVLWYTHEVQSDITSATKLMIAEQERRLATIAEITDRDGADAVVEKIIKDCSSENRAQFDTQLSRLPELKGTELIEIEKLFDACGHFFAQRKAVMTARLKREFEVYVDLISVLSYVDAKDATLSYDTELWGTLVTLEEERSTLSTRLVEIQGEIIRELMKKTPLSSDSMQATLVEGQETKEKLVALSVRIDEIRQEVIDI